MCRNLLLLAQNDRQQIVFTCEHGTIYITLYRVKTQGERAAGFL